jgi:hypothetical protein
MTIEFPCPGCGTMQRAGGHLVGRLLRCQSCRSPFHVPETSTAPVNQPLPQPAAVEEPLPPAQEEVLVHFVRRKTEAHRDR